jgi:hypothetical protein
MRVRDGHVKEKSVSVGSSDSSIGARLPKPR